MANEKLEHEVKVRKIIRKAGLVQPSPDVLAGKHLKVIPDSATKLQDLLKVARAEDKEKRPGIIGEKSQAEYNEEG